MTSHALSCSMSDFVLTAALSCRTLNILTLQMGKLRLREVKLLALSSCTWAEEELGFELRSLGSGVPVLHCTTLLLSA